MSLRISVVILNYNGSAFLRRFLPAVIEHSLSLGRPDGIEVVVADNASTDDSVDLLRSHFPQVKLLLHDVNDGYAGGYNWALRQIEAQYYVLLNSDVEVTPGWLSPIIDFMEHHPDVAACQPKILSHADKSSFEYAGAAGGFIDRLGYPFCRGRLFDTLEKDKGQYDTATEVFWASGACLFIRSDVFHRCGGFDPQFFAHMEEIDLCWRMKRSGYRIYCCPQSTVYHVGGGTLKKEDPKKTYLNFRNNLLMLKKNLPPEQSRQLLRTRLWMDLLAAGSFLARLQGGNFAAVLKAHRDIRKNKNIDGAARVDLKGMMNGSVVWQYYARGKKTFSDLEGIS